MNQTKNENWKRVLKGKEISSHKSQITPLQKQKEKAAELFRKLATEVEGKLIEFKSLSDTVVEHVMAKAYSTEDVQGKAKSFEFTNFDGSVKVRRELAKITKINAELLSEGTRLFNEYLASKVVPEDVAVIIRGVIEYPSLQVINVLIKMVDTVDDPLFTTAVECLRGSIEEVDTKSYTMVYVMVEEKYQLINLSISKV